MLINLIRHTKSAACVISIIIDVSADRNIASGYISAVLFIDLHGLFKDLATQD